MTSFPSLSQLGWHRYTQLQAYVLAPTHQAHFLARVLAEDKQQYRLMGACGLIRGLPTGRLMFTADAQDALPKVGDWVRVDVLDGGEQAVIHEVLPRYSCLRRARVGKKTRSQVIAANVDLVAVVMGLDNNYNPRRLERYLAMAHEAGARPLVVLTKADLCQQVAKRRREVEKLSGQLEVFVLSVLEGLGLDALKNCLHRGQTMALVGSSGVGKSTLVNALLGSQHQLTQDVRAGDHRGRHTTTRRELLLVPGGGMVIDTPGMRELQLWESDTGLAETFPEIDSLAQACRFADCSHVHEVGCAVQQAVEDGNLPEARLKAYHKLQKEQAYLEVAKDEHAFRKREKRLHKMYRKNTRRKRKRKGKRTD